VTLPPSCVVPAASVVRLVSAVVPPTAPAKFVVAALTVRARAPSTVLPKLTDGPVSVLSATSVAAPA
jgi:hypothetical protein